MVVISWCTAIIPDVMLNVQPQAHCRATVSLKDTCLKHQPLNSRRYNSTLLHLSTDTGGESLALAHSPVSGEFGLGLVKILNH